MVGAFQALRHPLPFGSVQLLGTDWQPWCEDGCLCTCTLICISLAFLLFFLPWVCFKLFWWKGCTAAPELWLLRPERWRIRVGCVCVLCLVLRLAIAALFCLLLWHWLHWNNRVVMVIRWCLRHVSLAIGSDCMGQTGSVGRIEHRNWTLRICCYMCLFYGSCR